MNKSPDQKNKPRIASAERRVKPLVRLLRCAMAAEAPHGVLRPGDVEISRL